MKRSELLSEITEKIRTDVRPDAPYLVAIEGKGCSGKTTIASELAEQLRGDGLTTSIMPIDNFCLPRTRRYRDDCPEAEQVYRFNFDYQLFDSLIAEASMTKYVSFAHKHLIAKTDRFDGSAIYNVSPGGVLIVEGIHVLRRHLIPHYDLKIYLDVSDQEQIARARLRDPGRGNSQAEIEYKYHRRYRPSYKMFLEEHRPEEIADLIIRNAPTEQPTLDVRAK